ncbi:uncharacterized protein LOC143891223 [Tasmannia lanceolata]|uniref:uncharacterized protein LOC143891223 n=1 Tax=Tasmannia lanceolata TaxID=3420 RepID=UPI004063A9A7
MARYVWSKIISRFGSVGVLSKISDLLESWAFSPWQKNGKILWNVALLTTFWVFWKERNTRLFRVLVKSPDYVYINVVVLTIACVRALPSFRFVLVDDLWWGWSEACMDSELRPLVAQVWDPPREGFFKLNFDGSSFRNLGPAAVGGLLRDYVEETCWAFLFPTGIADSNEAEITAVHEGVRLIDPSILDK